MKKTDAEDDVLSFMNASEYCPILLVEGVIPQYLSKQCLVLNLLRDEKEDTVLGDSSSFFEWMLEHTETVLNRIGLTKSTRAALEYSGDSKEVFLVSMCVGEVAKEYYRSIEVPENVVNHWFDGYVQWTLDSIEFGIRISEHCSVSETVVAIMLDFFARNTDILVFSQEEFKALPREELEKGRYLLMDDQYLYIPDRLFREVCSPLLRNNSLPHLKRELVEEGFLCTQDLSKENYTVKKEVRTYAGEICRPRLLRLMAEAFILESGMGLNEFFEMCKKGDKGDVNRIFE